ncbi:MAG TPA: hypothetical protein VGN37_31110 [Actinocatenispora sp.]
MARADRRPHAPRPVGDRVFDVDALPDALDHCGSGGGFGTVVLTHG